MLVAFLVNILNDIQARTRLEYNEIFIFLNLIFRRISTIELNIQKISTTLPEFIFL